MAYAAISKPSLYMNPKLYTGTGATHAITGVGFQPDLVWMKQKNGIVNHYLYDAVRGATNRLQPNMTTAADTTDSTWFNSFDSDGFTIGTEANINDSSDFYASWNWKAGTTTGIAGSPSITPLGYSFNATSGFSAIKYEGTGSAGTLPHGLGVAPNMIIVKALETVENWAVYNSPRGATKYIELNHDGSEGTSAVMWNDTEPTSTLFTVNTNGGVNTSGKDYIAYCFANVKGFSKVGSYIGNGATNGVFVYTGFKPAFILVKDATSTANWILFDNKREGYNANNDILRADTDAAEGNSADLDILSNGFKANSNWASINKSGATFIYLAVAEEPLVANVGASIPATAR